MRWRQEKALSGFLRFRLVVFIILTTTTSAQRYSAPRFMVERGPFTVGLKVIEQYDRTRLFEARSRTKTEGSASAGKRPLQTLVWYPAANSSLPSMTVGAYLALAKTETSFGHPQETSTTKEWNSYFEPVLTGPMYARRNATALTEHFPVVIYSPSFSSVAWENADLCEYLASFGYVVIAGPAMGARARESTHDLEGALAQASDVSFLIGFAQTLPNTDMTRVAVVGFSWGGLANLLAAARDSRVDALVSLDGSERYFPGFVKAAGFVELDKMTKPLLYFEEGDQSVEAQDSLTTRFHSQGPSVLNAWQHGDLMIVHMLGLFHPAFYSMSYRNQSIWQKEFPNLQVADYDYDDCLLQFSWVIRYTRMFLDAYMKDDAAAKEALKGRPKASGVPKHELAVSFRPANRSASTK